MREDKFPTPGGCAVGLPPCGGERYTTLPADEVELPWGNWDPCHSDRCPEEVEVKLGQSERWCPEEVEVEETEEARDSRRAASASAEVKVRESAAVAYAGPANKDPAEYCREELN